MSTNWYKTRIISPSDGATESLLLRIETRLELQERIDEHGGSHPQYVARTSHIFIAHYYYSPQALRGILARAIDSEELSRVKLVIANISNLEFLRHPDVMGDVRGASCERLTCEHCGLTSLSGAAEVLSKVGTIRALHNHLTDLKGLPRHVDELNVSANPNLARFNCDVDSIERCIATETNLRDLTGIHTHIRRLGQLHVSVADANWSIPAGLTDLLKTFTGQVDELCRSRLMLEPFKHIQRSPGARNAVVVLLGDQMLAPVSALSNTAETSGDIINELTSLIQQIEPIWAAHTSQRARLLRMYNKLAAAGYGHLL